MDRHAIGVLRKMYYYNYIGKRHTSIDNLQKSFPKHERGDVKKTVKKLIRANFIIPKSSTKDMHCSLNYDKIPEIEKLIEE